MLDNILLTCYLNSCPTWDTITFCNLKMSRKLTFCNTLQILPFAICNMYSSLLRLVPVIVKSVIPLDVMVPWTLLSAWDSVCGYILVQKHAIRCLLTPFHVVLRRTCMCRAVMNTSFPVLLVLYTDFAFNKNVSKILTLLFARYCILSRLPFPRRYASHANDLDLL